MISTSPTYPAAIAGSPRRVEILAVVDLSDPDLRWGPVISDSLAPWAHPDELHDKEWDPPPRYATLERSRWLLDGSFAIFPDDFQVPEKTAYCGNSMSGPDGTFSPAAFVEQRFLDVRILQHLTVFFSEDPADGFPVDFEVEVLSGDTVYFTQAFTGNRERTVTVTGFTVYYPDAVRVRCTRWSLPSRRMRVMEILTGLYERWGPRMLAAFSCTQQGDFSCLSLPYGSLSLSMDNHTRRFDPRRKDGIFQSIEERQGVDVYIGVRKPNGFYEHVRLGIFYQAGDGWKTSDNSLTMHWYLVDIIGLLANRTFLPPSKLPTTLGGWLAAVVAQLGWRFETRWSCDPAYQDKPVTAASPEAVSQRKCGDILRWACMASGTWPRADAKTGKLVAEPLWSQGSSLTLHNLTKYPTIQANQSIAALIFTLSDGTEYVVSGNDTAADATVSVQNPFLHTREQALSAARLILSCYGGNLLETTGRGDPACEIGDVDTVWLDDSHAAVGRRAMQTIQFQDGVMQGCHSRLLQADGAYLFSQREVCTESGTWTAPAGVTRLRLLLIGHGADGQPGTDGSYRESGTDGADGLGGLVWSGTIDIQAEQSFRVEIGQDSVFGQYSSKNGTRYPMGYSDIASGDSYGRTGVPSPLPGSGDGGKGGKGGNQGVWHDSPHYDADGNLSGPQYVIDVYPGRGTKGAAGAPGCVVIYWERGN